MKSNSSNDTALVPRDGRFDLWRDPEWQRLWLAMQVRPWRSLSIVPASSGGPKDFTLRIALTLARTGMVHLGGPVQVADATRVPLAHLEPFMQEIRNCTAGGDLILVAVAPIVDNPLTVSIATATDAALLCVLFEHMASSQAKKTVAQIGANRFIGSTIFQDGSLNMRAG